MMIESVRFGDVLEAIGSSLKGKKAGDAPTARFC